MKGKKVLALLLALLMMMTMLPLSALAAEEEPSKEPVNLLMNGSFDDPDLIDLYWWLGAEPYRGSTCAYQATGGVDDSGCIKMTGAGADAQACLFYQDLVSPAPACARIVPGRTYRVSVDVFRPEGVNATIRIDIENCVTPYAETTGEGKGEWEHLSYEIAPDIDGAWLRCYDLNKELLPDQYVLLDNYSIVCISDEQQPIWSKPSENLVRNGDFVNEAYWTADFPERYGGVDIAWLPEGGVDNSACLQYTVNGNANIGGLMYRFGSGWDKRVKLTEGYWYSFSVDVFLEEGLDKVIAIDGENLAGANALSTKTGEWEHLRYAFKAPWTGFYDLRVFLLDNIQSAVGKTAKIDNLRVLCLSAPVDPGFEPLDADDKPIELLMNSSFDDPDLINCYWWIGDEPYRGSTCSYQPTGGVNNSGCIKMVGAGTGAQACLFYQDQVSPAPCCARIQQGHTYRVSVDVFRPVGVNATIRIDIENCVVPYAETSGEGKGEWEHLSYDITPAIDGAWLRCYDLNKELLPGQYVLLDNYSIVCLTDAQQPMWSKPSANLVRNGDFVSESFCAIDYTERYGGVDLAWLPDGGVDNSSCLQYTINGNANVGGIMYRFGTDWENRVKLTEGYWYSFSVDVFLEEGLDKIMAIDGENMAGANALSTKTGEWEHLHYAFKAPWTGYYDLRVFLLDNIQSAVGKTAKIDNLRVLCLSEQVDPGFEPLAPDGAPGKNLLVGGNFNVANDGGVWPREDWHNISAGGHAVYTSMRGIDGTGAWIMTGGEGTDPGRAAGFVMHNQPLTLTAGTPYILSAKIFRPAGVASDVNVSVRSTEGDALMFRTPAPVKNGEWETVSVKFVATGNDTVWVMVRGEALPNGAQVIVDDVALCVLGGEPDDTPAWGGFGPNVLKNSDFSAGGTNWWPRDDWGGGFFRPTATNGVDNGPCFVAMGKGAVGHDTATGLWYKNDAGQYLINLTPGQVYCFSADVFRPEGTTGAVSLKIRRQEGDQVICSSDSTVKIGEWENIYLYFRAPEEPVALDVFAGSLPDGENLYVDNVMLRIVDDGTNPNTADIAPILPVALIGMCCSAIVAAVVLKKKKAVR